MSWRAHYQTRILNDKDYPVCSITTLSGEPVPEGDQVWLGSLGFEAISEQGTWWRLFKNDFPEDPRVFRVFVFDSVDAASLDLAVNIVPPSEARRTLLVADPSRHWSRMLDIESGTTAFAAMICGSTIPVVMVGSATEDAWDTFCQFWPPRT